MKSAWTSSSFMLPLGVFLYTFSSFIYISVILSGIAKKYSALHLGDYSDDELSKARSESERIQGKF